MKGSDKILVDTSVWIEFFRKKEPYYKIVGNWIDEDRICCIGLVLAELLQGVKTEKELSVIKDFLYVFEYLNESKELWEKAGELSFHLSKKGIRAGLSDCYIAAASRENEVGIITLDKHFGLIQKVIEIKLIEV
ncbi:MAG: PIN domain-containing protein [Deltaproteobacteria bacterium]|nr:PIN domain-containing protein [Deltaproteobacteria bacterium]